MDKIYTKYLLHAGQVIPGAGALTSYVASEWVLDEDIWVVGSLIKTIITTPVANDGLCYAEAALSEGASRESDTYINTCHSVNWWNTAPAGIVLNDGYNIVMFPSEQYIKMLEEGRLGLVMWGRNATAVNVEFEAMSFIYFLRKGRRR